MNLSTIALALLAWQLLSGGNKQQQKPNASPLDNISQFMNEDTKSILESVSKLSNKDSSQEDKTGAILQMITNPAVMNMASNLFKKNEKQPETNDEGYKFDTPSSDSREF